VTSKRQRFTSGVFEMKEDLIEIVAITTGAGNGWQFDADVLRESLALWEGVECFVDHAWPPRSVRDLAGSCSHARWDEALQGIRLSVSPCGPSAQVLGDLATARKRGPEARAWVFPPTWSSARWGTRSRALKKSIPLIWWFLPPAGAGFCRQSKFNPNQSRRRFL
jgi:hypothetical protein